MADHRWNRAPAAPLTPQALGQLQQVVNYPKGLHGDAFEESLTLPGSGPGSRMMLIGPQTIPASLTITLQPGSVMKII